MSDLELLAALMAMAARAEMAVSRTVPAGIRAIIDEAGLSLSPEDKREVLALAHRLVGNL